MNNRFLGFYINLKTVHMLIKTSEYVCTGRYPVQASAVFLNELIISLYLLRKKSCVCFSYRLILVLLEI